VKFFAREQGRLCGIYSANFLPKKNTIIRKKSLFNGQQQKTSLFLGRFFLFLVHFSFCCCRLVSSLSVVVSLFFFLGVLVLGVWCNFFSGRKLI